MQPSKIFMMLGLSVLHFTLLSAQENIVPTDSTPTAIVNDSTSTEIEEELLSIEELSKKGLSNHERTQLIFEAIENGDINMADTVANAMVYYRHNEEGETALTQAILAQDQKMVRMLTKKAVINLKNQSGETPLTLAVKIGNPEIIALVMHRAKAALKNDHDETPLWLAIQNGDLFIAQKLIDKGARVDHKSKGETPIFQAIRNNQLRMLALLIKNGADPSTPNSDGLIPLGLAVSEGKVNMAKILINRSKQPYEDANWKNTIGEPILVEAVRQESLDIVRLLLGHGAQTNYVDYMDNTALHLAASKGYRAIVSLLLQHGADPASTNMLGETAKQVAKSNGHQSLLDLFSLNENPQEAYFATSYDKE